MKPRSMLSAVVLLALIALVLLWGVLSAQRRHGAKPPAQESSAESSTPPSGAAAGNRPVQPPDPAPSPPGNPAASVVTAVTMGASPGTNATASTSPADDGHISASVLKQIAALESEKAARTPVQRKIDSQLLYADQMRRGVPIAAGVPTLRVNLDQDAQGRVLVDLKAVVTDELLRQIQALGGEVINSFPQYQAVRAAVPLAALEELAARPEVLFVGPQVRALHNTVISEGDYAHQANTARATFGVNGTGVKVGVLSDSVDYLSTSEIAGLVTVLPGQDGLGQGNTGEGTAMLEIVHDLAPGAQLYFATANNGAAQFATNILQLRFSYGCDIIVDDYTYYDESPFQDATIAQAVNAVTASGGLYFSSAANSGNLDSGTSGTWEGDFADDGAAGAPIGYGFIHSFGPADYDTVTVPSTSGADTTLFWSDPLGGSSNDYDLFVLDSTGSSVVGSSANYQTGTQDPYEHVEAPNAGERIVVVLASGTGRFLHLDTERGVLALGTQGSTRGHNAATNGFCVAAVNVADTVYPNGFAGGSQDFVETFSSDGPRRMFYLPNGTPITPGNFSSTGGAVFQKPDLTAADGVSTDVTGFAPFFFGTSAAAPHAAAIAALLKSYNPGLSASQVRTILAGTALDIMAPGTDRDSGTGIVMASTALRAAFPDALQVTPQTGFTSSGPAGGPFNPTAQSLLLTNSGAVSLNWSLSSTSSWLNASLSGGTLTQGGTNAVTMSLNSATAGSLVAGVYYANVGITNLNTGAGQIRRFTLVVQAATVHSSNPDAVLSFRPIAYWRLNETNQPPPADVATNSGSLGATENGFALDGVVSGQPGIVGNSFRFFNPNLSVPFLGSWVDVPYNAALNPNGPFTMEFWVKPAQLTSDEFCPAAAVDTTQNGGVSRLGWLFYQASDNTWQFRVGGLSGYAATLSGGTAQANVWQHIAGVYDGANVTLYVNGQRVAGPTVASGFGPNPTQPLRLGGTTFPNRGYDGWIDEAAIYATALSAGKIAAHFSAATTNNAGYASQILADNPVGYWRLNEPAYVPPDASTLPVAFNSGSALNVFGLFEPGSKPGVAGVPFGGFGATNRACQFNGVSGYIDVPGASALDITGPITLLAWVKANPPDGNVQSILSGGETSYHLSLDGNGYPGFGDGAQMVGDIFGVNPIADGQWHQLAGVYDGVASEFLYVDGQLAAFTTGATVPVAGSGGDVWIGAAPDFGSSRIFSGTIDEVAIFTNELALAQIQQIYSATNAPIAMTATKSNSTVSLAWNAVVGLNYQVQYKTNLAQTSWLNFGGAILATNPVATASDVIGPGSRRFYRVMLSQ